MDGGDLIICFEGYTVLGTRPYPILGDLHRRGSPLKTVKPLQLIEKRSLWDPQILEELSTPKKPPPRKTAKPLQLYAKTAFSKFPKILKLALQKLSKF